MLVQFIVVVIIFIVAFLIELKIERTFKSYLTGILSTVILIIILAYFMYSQSEGMWKFFSDNNSVWSVAFSFGFGIITGLVTTKIIERSTKQFTLKNMYIELWIELLRNLKSIESQLVMIFISEDLHIQYVQEILSKLSEMKVSLGQIDNYTIKCKRHFMSNAIYKESSIGEFTKYMNSEVSNDERDKLMEQMDSKKMKFIDKEDKVSLFYNLYLTKAISISAKKDVPMDEKDKMTREVIREFIKSLDIELETYKRDIYCKRCKQDTVHNKKCIITKKLKSLDCNECANNHNNLIHDKLDNGFFMIDEDIIADYLTFISKLKGVLALSFISKLKKSNCTVKEK